MIILRKNILFLFAGALWVTAGILVSRVGITAFIRKNSILIFLLAVIIFLLFYFLIFSKLVKKHEKRIMNDCSNKLPFYMFFDKKGYLTMLFFIMLGIVIRKSEIMPTTFFSFFYTGLGLALFTSGLQFIYFSYKHRSFDKK